MQIRIGFDITIETDVATPVLLALYPRPEEDARITSKDGMVVNPYRMPDVFFDEFNNRRARLVAGPGETTLSFDAIVEDDGQPDPVFYKARQHPIEELPVDALRFLAASRFCESDLLLQDAWRLFGHTNPGWPRVQAICDFVHQHISFGYGHARPTKTAMDAYREGRGVCRDFAHLSIAFCRAMNIPARYVSGYLGDIGVPPSGAGDFCAWFEAYLGGRWHTFDARYNVPRIGRVRMVRGRDAGDVPMLISFGDTRLMRFEVHCDEVISEIAQPPFMAGGLGSPDVDDELDPLFAPVRVRAPATAGAAQWHDRFTIRR